MIAAGGTRQPKIMKRSAELPLIASALRFALDSPRRQLQIQERLERRLYLPAPEHRGSWFVLRHGSGEVRPSILARFTTIEITPFILASYQKTPTHG